MTLLAMECWAACLGDCNDRQSGEHIVSRSLFVDEEIDVTGFSWCRETKRIPVATLTKNILCKHHNSMLSPVDKGGANAFKAFRESMALASVRGKLGGRFTNIVKHPFDGPMLERWLLKTVINIAYDGVKFIGHSNAKGMPSDELVRIAFGLDPFPGRAGLSFAVPIGAQFRSVESLTAAPLVKEPEERIDGCLFLFRGFLMVLFFGAQGVPTPLIGVQFMGVDLGRTQMNFHNDTIHVNVGKHRSQSIKIAWPDGTGIIGVEASL